MNQKGLISLASVIAISFTIGVIGLASWRVFSYTADQPEQENSQQKLTEPEAPPSSLDDSADSSPAQTTGSNNLVTPPADAPFSSDDDEYDDD